MARPLCFALFLVTAVVAIVFACGPPGTLQPHCVNAMINGLNDSLRQAIFQIDSDERKLLKAYVLMQVNFVLAKKRLDNLVNPPPRFCRFVDSNETLSDSVGVDLIVNAPTAVLTGILRQLENIGSLAETVPYQLQNATLIDGTCRNSCDVGS